MAVLARRGLAHGDLSVYNVLAQGDRVVIIDLPQVLDIVGNQNGVDFLLRDCRNVPLVCLARLRCGRRGAARRAAGAGLVISRELSR